MKLLRALIKTVENNNYDVYILVYSYDTDCIGSSVKPLKMLPK